MGNKLARTTQISASEYYLHDLPSSCNLVLKEVLGGGRILKSVQCLHDEGLLLVKVYFKRGEFPDLKEHERRLYRIREELMKIEHSHVWPFQYWLETDKAAYLLRQYFFSNLHDRISTRPFLSMIEKKWLAFQLLLALRQCHERGVCHGDIKCENVLVTSWNWLYLADFASFKPTYLPFDNPADFSFFFDTGGRRRCYLAPERFCEPVGDTHIVTDAPLKPAMDIFSLGCVIAELFSEGQALFDYSQLLAYRRGQYDPCPSLQKVPDPGIREMIIHMIQLDPDSRLSSAQYMQRWAPLIFPAYFSPLLHGFFSCLLPLDTDTRVAVTSSAFSEICKQMITSSIADEEHTSQVASDAVASKGPAEGEHGQDSVQTYEEKNLQSTKGENFKSRDFGSNIHYGRSQSLPNVSCQELISDINALLRDGGHSTTQLVSSVAADPLSQPALELKKARSEKDLGRANSFHVVSHTTGLRRLVERSVPVARGYDEMDRVFFSNSYLNSKGVGSDRFARSMRRFKAAAIAIANVDSMETNLDPEGRAGMKVELFEQFNQALGGSTLHGEEQSNRAINAINCEGMVLIASLLCASLRNVKLPQARRGAIQLLHDSSLYIDDDARLQHVLPYVAALLSDPAAIVRCAALQTVCDVLSLVQSFPPSDSKIFPEYILPLLSMLPDDPEESVRICYSNNIHKIAETACRFLVGSQYPTELAVLDRSAYSLKGPSVKTSIAPSLHHHNAKYDTELAQLRESIAHIIQELVMGQKQSPSIRRALLQHVGNLCRFFGQKQCNDFLLPILPAFLNDRDEQLRAIFFEHIVHVCLFVGQTSVEAYLLPYIEQALSDVEETVIVNALECLAALCVHKLLRKRVLLGAVERAAPLLCHPSQWVRRSAITFVSSTSANLDMADSHAFLSPILTPFLRREPVSLCSETSLLTCLKPPMSREVFNRVLSDVMLSQTASEVIDGKQMTKVRQRPSLPHLHDNNQTRPALERHRMDKEGSIVVPISDVRNSKSSHTRWTARLDPNVSGDSHRLNVTELDDGEKMKAMEGYIRNLSSTMQSRMHNWEMENSEKLQNSVIGMTAGVGAGFYSNYDGSSEGIPLYSVPLHERKSELQGVPSFNEEWSRIAGVRQGAPPFHMATFSVPPSGSSTVSSQWLTGHLSMPTGGDYMQRSRMMSSFPPKLMSGSLYGGSLVGPRRVYEVIRDVSGREGEHGYMSPGISHGVATSRVKDPSSLESGTHGFLSAVEPGMAGLLVSESATGLSYSGTAMLDGQWHPKGVLIAHMQEHQRSVNEIAVSHDNAFFVSASDDGSVKVWDCRRLESNISFRSRLTYNLQNGRALHVSMLGNGAQVAAASNNGVIHVFSVDYVAKVAGSVERYSGITDVKKLETQEGAVLSLQNYSLDGPQMLLYTTQRNGIHLWDFRSQNDVWSLKAKPIQGYISATALDSCANWLVTATTRGIFTLWDIRFQIPVNSWQHPLSCAVETMQSLMPKSDPAAVSSLRPFIYVAAGKDELALWNAEDGTCHQVLKYASDAANFDASEIPSALVQRPKSVVADSKWNEGPKRNDYRLDELNEPPSRLPGIRALLPLSNGAALLTGGTDCKIRFWDRLRPERSYCVCGPSVKTTAATDAYKYDSRVVAGVLVVQELCNHQGNKTTPKSCFAVAAIDTVGCHRDSVLSLVSVQANQHLLISSCRDGAIKVWK